MTSPAVAGGDVRLRDVTEADLPVFFEQQLDPDAVRMAAFPSRPDAPHVNRGEHRAHHLDQIERVLAAGHGVAFPSE